MTGSFDDLLSWAEMDYDKFNIIGENKWTADSILDWEECSVLDEIQSYEYGYTWGYTKH